MSLPLRRTNPQTAPLRSQPLPQLTCFVGSPFKKAVYSNNNWFNSMATPQRSEIQRSEKSKCLLFIGVVLLLLGLIDLFWIFLIFSSAVYLCPANGCDQQLIEACFTFQNIVWIALGLFLIGTGAGVVAYGVNYDRHRRIGLILLILAIVIVIVIIGNLYNMTENFLTIRGVISVC
jgi:hypothetical protein